MDLRHIQKWSINNNSMKYVKNFNYKGICSCFNVEHKCKQNFKILKRIGSDSTEGEVYAIEFTSIDSKKSTIAVKIMPRLIETDAKKNKQEIIIATRLGQEKGFLPILDSSVCNSVFFQQTSKFYKPNSIVGDLLLSPLKWGDLTNYKRYNDTESWKTIILSVFKSIHDMQILGLIHNDLHHGNVLINPHNLETFIHDFGKSYIFDLKETKTMDIVLFDIDRFILSLQTLPFPDEMSTIIQKLIDVLDLYEETNDPSKQILPLLEEVLN
jgi:serine/threonine protein kinase